MGNDEKVLGAIKEREEQLPPALTLDDVEFGASGNGVLPHIKKPPQAGSALFGVLSQSNKGNRLFIAEFFNVVIYFQVTFIKSNL